MDPTIEAFELFSLKSCSLDRVDLDQVYTI